MAWAWNMAEHIDGLVQERLKSIANALDLRLSCANPSMCCSKLTCCQHRAILIVRWREFWAWHKDVLIKSCGATDSRGDLIRGRCLRPTKTVTCFIWLGWTVSFLLIWGCIWFVIFGRNMTARTVRNLILPPEYRSQHSTRCPRLLWCIGDIAVSWARATEAETIVIGNTASSIRL